MQAIIGIFVVLGLAWALSEHRREVRWLPILVILGIQLVIAATLIRVPFITQHVNHLNVVVNAISSATSEGTSFVFDYLGGGQLPFELKSESPPYIFATQLLPQILVFAVLVAILWYWRVLPMLIKGIAWVLQRTVRIGGAVSVAAAASFFVGMVESPMMIRGYLKSITRSEFFIVITCGMSTVAGSMMVLYVLVLGDVVESSLGHIVSASILNIFGSILIASVMVPDDRITTAGEVEDAYKYNSFFDALTRGATDGTKVVINIIAMLIVFISLVALINQVLGLISIGGEPLTLQRIAAIVFQPFTWCMGIPWSDANSAGHLMGTKLVINELVAYDQLGRTGGELTMRSNLILTYAICGFTNVGSVGILIGGISSLVPERRKDLLSLAPRTLISGTLVAMLTGSIVGVVSIVG